MKKQIILFVLYLSAVCSVVNGQETIDLYESGKIPNSIAFDNSEQISNGIVTNVSIPQLLVFKAQKENSNKTAMLICPGGSYHCLHLRSVCDVAETLAMNGVTSFVLKYRLPNDKWCKDKSTAPIQDAQRAMQIIRQQSDKWNIDSMKVGVLGQSAGGHLAACVSYLYDNSFIDNKEGVNLRPDFSILIYPVITMDTTYTHMTSRINLLGRNPAKNKQDLFSPEKNIKPDAPSTFILHANDDKVVPVENSLLLYKALMNSEILVDMHLFSSGGHGFGYGISKNRWLPLCIEWLTDKGYIKSE